MSLVDEINRISGRVLALEKENEHLRAEAEARKPDPNVERLLDLLGPDIARIENLTINGRLAELITVYRALRPIAKEGQVT